MKGIIFYYSGSGNTKLACQYIGNKMKNIEVELFDMVRANDVPDLNNYDLVGFAAFADFFGPSQLVEQFIGNLPNQEGKLSFVFNTYGNMTGKTLLSFSKIVAAKGFNVVAGFSLKTPQSYVPQIVIGRGADIEPDDGKMVLFNEFIHELDEIAASFKNGEEIKSRKVRVGFLSRLMPTFPRTIARRDMGEKSVDESLCTECGICESGCPYSAIVLDPKPKFDMTKCYGCWYCYNHCPEKAIYTKKFRDVGHYPKPNAQFTEKMKV